MTAGFPFDWLEFEFMRNALIGILMITPLFALLGCLVINSQMTFFSEAIGHSALTGIAIGAVLGMADPLGSMLVFAILFAAGVTLLRKHAPSAMDTVIGLCMAFTVALGVVLLSRNGGFAKYSKYLIGDILSMTGPDLARLGTLAVLIVGLWLATLNKTLFVSLNRSLARSRGIPVWLYEMVFAMVVAVVVTACIQWVGLLVINSLLILPAAASRNLARNVPQYFLIAICMSLFSGVTGLILSFYTSTATGATIVLVAMALFIVSLGARKALRIR